jgi:hypothetical protein
MRKYIIPLLVAILALGFVVFKNYNSRQSLNIQENQQTGYETRANLAIDFGNKDIKSFELTVKPEDTAFSVLKITTEKEKINLETKQYDFGIFVKKIGEFESTTKKSWIYYVNDKSGDVAADKYQLKNGDKVIWKYETPK